MNQIITNKELNPDTIQLINELFIAEIKRLEAEVCDIYIKETKIANDNFKNVYGG